MGVERPQPQMQAGPRNTQGQATNRMQGQPQQGHAGREHRGEGRGESREQLSSAQIYDALNKTWTGFNTQLGRDYSSITLNLPKKPIKRLSSLYRCNTTA